MPARCQGFIVSVPVSEHCDNKHWRQRLVSVLCQRFIGPTHPTSSIIPRSTVPVRTHVMRTRNVSPKLGLHATYRNPCYRINLRQAGQVFIRSVLPARAVHHPPCGAIANMPLYGAAQQQGGKIYKCFDGALSSQL